MVYWSNYIIDYSKNSVGYPNNISIVILLIIYCSREIYCVKTCSQGTERAISFSLDVTACCHVNYIMNHIEKHLTLNFKRVVTRPRVFEESLQPKF